LTLAPAAAKGPWYWRPGAAFAIMHNEAQIGRIDIHGNPQRDGEAQISLREQVFDCRIHITGQAHWNWVPARWVMYSGSQVLHGAIPESGKTFFIDNEPGQQPLRLRREASTFVVERASDQTRVGAIRRTRGRLVPKPAGPRIVLETSIDLPESLEVMLLWVVVQDEYQSGSE
jgi:hypothetical protein